VSFWSFFLTNSSLRKEVDDDGQRRRRKRRRSKRKNFISLIACLHLSASITLNLINTYCSLFSCFTLLQKCPSNRGSLFKNFKKTASCVKLFLAIILCFYFFTFTCVKRLTSNDISFGQIVKRKQNNN